MRQIKTFIGLERWTRLEIQAVEQGVRLEAVTDHAIALGQARHPDNEPAATACAAIHVLIACNSQPNLKDIQRYELAQKSSRQHPQETRKTAKKRNQTETEKSG
jgi:hypothetical protein